MVKIKSYSVGNGDMFYIKHGSKNFTVIDCNLIDGRRIEIMKEVVDESKDKNIIRFISTHPDEDHFYGLEFFNNESKILNFYCVENKAVKDEETSDFKFYKKLRDGDKKYYIEKNCSRKWMNKNGKDDKGNEIGSSGINILWPDIKNKIFRSALEKANKGESPNNISPIIKYELDEGATVLWFGDLETEFMQDITNGVDLPKADIIFAPHHGRNSGAIPSDWLNKIEPKIIIIGEAASSNLQYYPGYETITQISVGDITMYLEKHQVDLYVSSESYINSLHKPSNLIDCRKNNKSTTEIYLGTLAL